MRTKTHFGGFLPPTSSTTYCPNQFFDVVLRHGTRGAVRLVAYLIRKTLGWSDARGRPQEPKAVVSWRELETRAGVGHSSMRAVLDECLSARYIDTIHPGNPARPGAPASTACYALRWDDGEAYTTDPARFDGFYSGNGNLTYIPNQYFDVVVPREPLALQRVVGAVIRQTIGFQTKFGFRRQEVHLSHAALMRYTNLSHEAVRLGLREAIRRGFVVCLTPGVFDTNAGKASRPGLYGIHWKDEWDGASARKAGEARNTGAHKIPNAEPALRSMVRQRSEPLCGKRSGTLHGKKTTGKNTTKQQQAPSVQHAAAAEPERIGLRAPSKAYRRLLEVGFDAAAASLLAERYPLDRIERQCDWLARRKPSRNRLGMLRKAIEEDWPEPPAYGPVEGPAAVCAGAYYDRLRTRPSAQVSSPSAEDLQGAAALVERLEAAGCDVSRPDRWGSELAGVALRTGPRPATCAGSFATAMSAHCEALLRLAVQRRNAALARELDEARRLHRAAHRPAYLAYLRALRDAVQAQHREAYSRFEQEEQRQRDSLTTGFVARAGLTERMLVAFDNDEEHLARFQSHFQAYAAPPALDFWAWDRSLNPHPFVHRASASTAEAPAAHRPDGPISTGALDRA